jgi:hypothetical protein
MVMLLASADNAAPGQALRAQKMIAPPMKAMAAIIQSLGCMRRRMSIPFLLTVLVI